jgi:hypothetical protein
MTRGWMLLGGLVLASSAVPLTQVALDRHGAPRATMTLSQRELTVGWIRDENSGVTVNWTWAMPPFVDSLTRDQVDSIGARCPGIGYDCDGRSGTRGWIVVGLDTVAWQRSLDSARTALESAGLPAAGDSTAKRRHDEAQARFDQLDRYTSRLRMVAVGRDPYALLARWNDGKHLVLPARLWVFRETYPRADLPGETPRFSIHADPWPTTLHVPVEWTGPLRDPPGAREPRYDVTVSVGSRWLPSVVGIFRR